MPAPASGVANPPGPILWSGLLWSHKGTRRLPLLPAPVKHDVCEDVFEPRGGLRLHAQDYSFIGVAP